MFKALSLFRGCFIINRGLSPIIHGLDVEAFNGPGRNVLSIPGTFIIDRKGIIRGMHADTDHKERMEPAEILGVLQMLQ